MSLLSKYRMDSTQAFLIIGTVVASAIYLFYNFKDYKEIFKAFNVVELIVVVFLVIFIGNLMPYEITSTKLLDITITGTIGALLYVPIRYIFISMKNKSK